MINSLLDTDLYKLTMMQSALHQFSTVDVEYDFKCRNLPKAFTPEMVYEINKEIDKFCQLKFNADELNYLSGIRFFHKDFIDFLSLYKPNRNHIVAYLDDEGLLKIKVHGPWYLTIPFEVPVLAIVNEVYFNHQGLYNSEHWVSGGDRLEEKVNFATYNNFSFVDFGTRRRFSHDWQGIVIEAFLGLKNFAGTSNVYFAKKYGIKPIGTMAHEYIMVGQGREDTPLKNSQKAQLQSWVDEYRGDLGIALSDTLGIDAFLKDFDSYFAKLYDGLRHDSGDPMWWAEKVISHYEELGIDPKTKTLVFSDGLNMKKAAEIYTRLNGRAKSSFGIGTNLTNDFEGVDPLQIVMKVTTVNGRPVAKISDSPGKGMCHDEHFLTYLKSVFNIEI